MDNTNQTGKKLSENVQQTKHNLRRKKENFLKPDATVNNLNNISPFRITFDMTLKSTATLNLKITEIPTPCTINPPKEDRNCTTYLYGDNPGILGTLLTNNGGFEIVNPGATVGSAIKVPVDGCYSIYWTSGAYGAGYFGDKQVSVIFFHNDVAFRLATLISTGFLAILGPSIYFYVPQSPLYGVIECKAGDLLSFGLTENDISQGYPWVAGTALHGFFYNPAGGVAGPSTRIGIDLIAEAEA